MISIIVAVAENGTIGDRNTLLWHISEDLKHFKALTSGHPVIMGRKTYESLGRPLPNRTNVVLTRGDGEFPGCRVVHALDEALAHIARYSSRHSEAIVTEDPAAADAFTRRVDAACVYVNVSTAFTDGGQFGFGAEVGISTQKLHARGPMGLPELTTYKYIVSGDGQTREG